MDSRRLTMFIGGYIGPLASNAVLAMVPVLKAEFGAGAKDVLLAVTFYMLPFALFNLISGTVSDIYGRRKVLTFGFLLYALSNVLCALSPNLPAFYLFRSMQGIGYAFANPVLMAVLGDITPPEERGRAMGYFGAFTTAGIATGPMIAGLLIPYGWRWTFMLVAVLALGVIVWIRAVCPAVRPDMEAFRHLKENVEAAVRTRGMAALCLLGFLTFLCYMGALGFLSDHLSLPPLSLDERTIGVMVGMSGVAGIVAAPIGGRLVDGRGRTRTALTGFLTMALALSLLYLSREPLQFAVSLLVLGIGTAFIWTALLTLAVEIVPGLKGTTSSIFNSARFFGYSLAPLLFAPIYSFLGFGTVLLVGLGLTVSALLVVGMLAAQLGPSHSDSTRSS